MAIANCAALPQAAPASYLEGSLSLQFLWNRREAGREPKNNIAWGHDVNWLEPNRSKMTDSWLPLDPESQRLLVLTQQQVTWHIHDSPEVSLEGQKWVLTQFLEILTPSPK